MNKNHLQVKYIKKQGWVTLYLEQSTAITNLEPNFKQSKRKAPGAEQMGKCSFKHGKEVANNV